MTYYYKANQELGRWLCRQRTLLRSKKMANNCVAKLKWIGFGDAPSNLESALFYAKPWVDWETCFQQLVINKQNHGNCDVPYHYEPNQDLGHWVSTQLSLLKDTKKMANDRAAKLESIGFGNTT
jgi:hypothetical protein